MSDLTENMDNTTDQPLSNEEIGLIREFVNRLYSEKQFGDLDPAIVQQIKEDLYEETKTAIETALIESLNEADLETYTEIAERGDAKEAANFLTSHLLDYAAIIEQTFTRVRASYLLS
jgi:hypothetical protein